MKPVIAEEVAREEILTWAEHLDKELSEDEIKDLLPAAMRGMIIFDESDNSFLMTLKSPIKLENDTTVENITLREPTAKMLQTVTAIKDQMASTIRLLSLISGHPVGIIERMGQRDVMACAAVLVFFA